MPLHHTAKSGSWRCCKRGTRWDKVGQGGTIRPWDVTRCCGAVTPQATTPQLGRCRSRVNEKVKSQFRFSYDDTGNDRLYSNQAACAALQAIHSYYPKVSYSSAPLPTSFAKPVSVRSSCKYIVAKLAQLGFNADGVQAHAGAVSVSPIRMVSNVQ